MGEIVGGIVGKCVDVGIFVGESDGVGLLPGELEVVGKGVSSVWAPRARETQRAGERERERERERGRERERERGDLSWQEMTLTL